MVKDGDGGEIVPRVAGALIPTVWRQAEDVFFKGLQAIAVFGIIVAASVGVTFHVGRVWERRQKVVSSTAVKRTAVIGEEVFRTVRLDDLDKARTDTGATPLYIEVVRALLEGLNPQC